MLICMRGVRPDQRPENKYAIVPHVHRTGVVRLPATEGFDASTRWCGSRSTREVHNRRKSNLWYIIALMAEIYIVKTINQQKLKKETNNMLMNFGTLAEILTKMYVKIRI